MERKEDGTISMEGWELAAIIEKYDADIANATPEEQHEIELKLKALLFDTRKVIAWALRVADADPPED